MTSHDQKDRPGVVTRSSVRRFNVDVALLRSLDIDVGTVDRTTLRRLLPLLCLGVVLVRATYVLQPLRNDEGGYLLIARQWHTGGEFLYGDYFVDRPPLLVMIYRFAALTEWDGAIRVIAIPFALLFVLAAWHAGNILSGRSGGRWSAVVAAGLMCSPALAADQADGELFAAALVMTSIALALSAWNALPSPRQLWLAGVAGVFAGSAPLVKQNVLEGLLFMTGLVVVASWARRGTGPREVLVGTGAFVGALFPYALVWLWATMAGIDPASIWRDLASFRGAAFEVIWSSSPEASITRAVLLLVLGLVSGALAVVVTWLVAARRRPQRSSPEHRAITGLVLFGIAAITAGGSYWPNYLLQLAPAVVLAAGAVAPSASRTGRWMRASSRVIVGAAVLGSVVTSVVYATVPWVSFQQRTGEWLADSKAAGDTAFVAYGNASVLEAADMQSPYPHLWSVPMRTLDPEQERLRATLAGPEAPSWIVQVNGLNSWQIDAGSRLRDLVDERYRVVATICGDPVWLRQDLTRQLAPPPRC